ncbi:MAG: FKBP-type peptidyl-prolyl cis-trans isomerase [Candidatus Micrarchaeia archaeon]|jgi:FKBP-type peptidyl-prolyl cis-trans isomerase 2
MDSVKQGDVVLVDFVARKSSDNAVFATTIKAEGDKANLHEGHDEPGHVHEYKPMMIVAGKGQTIKGLDDAIVGSEVGKKKSIKISVDNAFGQRDASRIRLIPIGEFRKREIQPYPGMPLELDGGLEGIVKSVEAGRVKVDFNAPLAGEDLQYDFTVTKCASTPAEKIAMLLFGVTGLETSSYDAATGVAKVKIGTSVRKDSAFMMSKVTFVSMALQYVDGLKKVVCEEEYSVEKDRG